MHITFQKWYQTTPACDSTPLVELTERELHVEQRYTTNHQHYAVGNQERPWKQKDKFIKYIFQFEFINFLNLDFKNQKYILFPLLA